MLKRINFVIFNLAWLNRESVVVPLKSIFGVWMRIGDVKLEAEHYSGGIWQYLQHSEMLDDYAQKNHHNGVILSIFVVMSNELIHWRIFLKWTALILFHPPFPSFTWEIGFCFYDIFFAVNRLLPQYLFHHSHLSTFRVAPWTNFIIFCSNHILQIIASIFVNSYLLTIKNTSTSSHPPNNLLWSSLRVICRHNNKKTRE